MKYWDDTQAFSMLLIRLNKAIADEFKILLEQKHVYQKVEIGAPAIFSEVKADLSTAYTNEFDAKLQKISTEFALSSSEFSLRQPLGKSPMLLLNPVNVSLFCRSCDRREAHRPIWYKDATEELRAGSEPHKLKHGFQLFTLVYQCQRCHGAPDAMLVRREEWRLVLDGRSPIENIEVPAYIPKAERHFYRDGIVALHGGKTLAALFYLRIFIEQFARRQTKLMGRQTGDEIMTAYSELLPAKERDFMPSLKEWYEHLSEAIHGAQEDATLFERAKQEIERHFEFRKIFEIKDANMKNAQSSPSNGKETQP